MKIHDFDILQTHVDGDVTTCPMYHSGDWQSGLSGDHVWTHNPADESRLAQVPDADEKDVAAALDSALAAQADWARLTPAQRANALARLAASVESHVDELALLEAIDSGNPVTAMKRDVTKGAEIIRHMGGLGYLLTGQTVPVEADALHMTRRSPWGVVARIVAFNHPFLFACGRIASALVAGNAVILKPSEQSPLSALALARLAHDCLPPGVLSVLTGGARLGSALTSRQEIERISFTGSIGTALRIVAQGAQSGHMKTSTFELGGKNPMIVFPDADLDRAAIAAVRGMNFAAVQGQSCGSTSRLFLHEDIKDAVLERLVPLVEQLKIGLPTDPETDMGCLISEEARQRCLRYIEMALRDGATLATGGHPPDDAQLADGYFLQPTVLIDVPDNTPCATEEIFGPVLSVFTWSDVDDVLTRANAVRYGLTAAVWTENVNEAFRAADRLDAGYVWINDVERRHYGIPFGGWKDSGVGAEYGLEEPLSFTREKTILVNYGR